MKKILTYLGIALCAGSLLTGCELDLYPVTSYNEGNVTLPDDDTENQYNTRTDMEGLRNSIYNSWMKDLQECGYNDYLIINECRADNAYAGSATTSEIIAIESNKIDAENHNVTRDWNWYLGHVSNANQIICNIDSIAVKDATLTETELKEWKSEALIWRAFNLMRLAELWGDAPVVTVIPPAITAENVEEVYPLYFPARTPVAEVYAQIIADLEYAAENAPAAGADKFLLSREFAWGLLARVYAEPAVQDWSKVSQYCQQIEDSGKFELLDNYGDLWGYTEDDAFRNSKESICEVTWTKSAGNWFWMMFHRNAYNPDDSYSWQKWVTPSRDLINAYNAEGDKERLAGSVIFDSCGWSTYWPENEYAFMHKVPTNATSLILMRLAEIYLLHAEALCGQGDLEGAAGYVNKVRDRAGLTGLKDSDKASQQSIVNAILKERRLELAFEGFRFHDLVRYGMAEKVCAEVATADENWSPRAALTNGLELLPVPLTEMDKNPSLNQNPGY